MIGATESGLKAAQKNLYVRSNNLANAATIGFKKSTISFADIFPNDPSSSPKTSVGAGVTTSAIDKSMTQGSISSTGKVTDIAISGSGFFVLGDVKPAVETTVTTISPPAKPVVSPVFNGAGLTMATIVPQDTQTKSVQLNINYGTSFKNGDFSDTAATVNGNVTTINGWEIHNEQVMLGQNGNLGTSLIGGFQAPIDTTQAFSPDGFSLGDDSIPLNAVYTENFNNGSLNLTSSMKTKNPGDIVHGPYVISDQYINISPGAVVSFDWKAEGGNDAYDIYAYLLKDDGNTIELLNKTANSDKADTGWMPFSQLMGPNEGGNYKFVFVSGTFDYTFGTAAGANLSIDNVKISGGDNFLNNGDTYEVNINGIPYSSGGPDGNLKFDLTNSLANSNNNIEIKFNNPTNSWPWSYELVVNGDVVKTGNWDGTNLTSITDTYNLINDDEPLSSNDNSSPNYNWSSSDYSGKAQNVYLRNSGSGTNSANGFSNQPKYIAFGSDGSIGERNLQFNPIDLSNKDFLSMNLIKGNDSNGGEFPDPMEDLQVYYSIDGGVTFKLLRQFNSNDISYNKWTSQKISLPTEAKSSSTIIRFKQPQSSGPQYDHWGLANIQFSSQPADPIPVSTTTMSDEVLIQQVYTRAGSFELSKDGYLINSSGLKLLGYDLKKDKNLAAINIPFNNGTEEGQLQGIYIDSKGTLSVNYAGDQTPTELYRISVANFPNSTGLRSIGDTNFASSGSSGKPSFGFGGENGYGTIMSGSLEESNVDITEEIIQLLRGQQVYNANTRVLQTLVEVNKRVTDKL